MDIWHISLVDLEDQFMRFLDVVGENVGREAQLDAVAMLDLKKSQMYIYLSVLAFLNHGVRVIRFKVVPNRVEMNMMVLGWVEVNEVEI